MPAPPSSKQKAANAASMAASKAGGGAGTSRSSGPPSRGAPSKSTGSGAIGSKGGGASTQKSGAGGNAGQVTSKSLGAAKTTQQQARTTALGKVSQAAKNNAQSVPRNIVSMSGNADAGLYGRFTPSLPSMRPGASVMGSEASKKAMQPGGWLNMQRTPAGYSSAFVNSSHVPMVNYSGSFASQPWRRDLSEQGNKLMRAVEDTALRTNQPINVFSGRRPFGSINHVPGYAVDTYMRDPVTGRPVGEAQIGAAAQFPIARAYNPAIEATLAKPYRAFADNVFDTAYQNPDAYSGVAEDVRWGGLFGGRVPKDYMHFDVTPGGGINVGQTKMRNAALARADGGTLASGTMLAGGGVPPAAMSVAPERPVQVASAALGSVPIPRPKPQMSAVPTPRPRPLQSFVAEDPRLGMTPGTFPAAAAPPVPQARPQAPLSQPAYDGPRPGQYSGYGEFTAPMQSRVATDPRVAATPLGRLPAAPERPRLTFSDAGIRKTMNAAPARPKPFRNGVDVMEHPQPVPPTPDQYFNRPPRAEPHPGTPASQTATVDDAAPSWWEKGANLVQVATDKAAEVKKTVQQGAKEAKKYEKQIAFMDKVFGPGWALGLTGGTAAQTAKKGGGAGVPMLPSSMPVQTAQAEPQPTAAELNALLEAMRLKGATPEEIAFIESLLASQVA